MNSRETLEAWLQDKPHDWAVAIAHRAALRVLPIALSGLRHIDRYGRLDLTLALFRLAAVSPASSLYPNLHVAGRVAMHEAAAELFQLAPRYSRSSILIDSAAAITAFADDALDAAYAADQYSLTGAFADSSIAALTAKEVSSTGAAAITSFAFAAHEVGVGDGFWACIRHDCQSLEKGRMPRSVLMQPLWSVVLPDVIGIEIAEYTSFLSKGDRKFDLWIDWYRRRLFGHPSYFRLGLNLEEELSRRLIDASDEWWKREPALVNGDIKAWIAELTPEPDEDAFAQNPFTENFIADEHGQIGIVPLTTPNGLIDDDDACRFHTECQGEIIGAIEVSGISQTQATDVLGPLQALLVAVGEAVGLANPQAFVTKLEKLRTLYDLRDGDADMVTPFTLLQKVEISSVLKIGDAWIAFDGKLATIRDGTYGPGYPRISVEPSAVRIIIEDARSMGVARADAHQLIVDTSADVPENAAVDDRRRITLGARFGNFIRATGRFIWKHKGKITLSGVGAAIGFINKNAVMLAEMFAGSPTLVEIINWISKLKL